MRVILEKAYRETKKKIVKSLIYDLILSCALTIIYFINPTKIEVEMPLITFFIFSVITFSVLILLAVFVLEITFQTSIRYRKFGYFILICAFSYLIITGYKFLIGVAIAVYPSDSIVSDSDRINTFLQFISLLIAILMPLYLTERNRKESERTARENKEYNEKLIFDNRRHSENIMQNEMRMKAVPIFSYEITGVNDLQNDPKAINYDRIVFIKMKNVSDRIATWVTYRNDGSMYVDADLVKNLLKTNPFIKNEEVTFKINVNKIVDIMEENEITHQPLTIDIRFKDIYNNEYSEKIFVTLKRISSNNFKAHYNYASVKRLIP